MAHHTKDKGDLAVILIIADLKKKDYDIFIPVATEHLPFDIIAYKSSKTYRIQVKYSSSGICQNKTSWSDKNGTHVKTYDFNDFDYYAIYHPSIDRVSYASIKFGGITIATTVPNCATPFYWWEDFQDLTNKANKKSYKDFGITLTKTITDKVISAQIKFRKVIRPSKEECLKLVQNDKKSLEQIGKDFGVSGKAIAKWFKFYNIIKPYKTNKSIWIDGNLLCNQPNKNQNYEN